MKLQTTDLDKMQLLEGLDPIIQNALLTHFHTRTYAKNESVVQKGLASAELYFLVSGRLKVVDFIQNGREIGFVFINGFNSPLVFNLQNLLISLSSLFISSLFFIF